ncbi:acyl-CoA dehydrogenase [Actinomadura sp. LD22]|uniref:Acyl-CoA dehydrogenase n=1 Tax=Actinomadura physcomitrii TaxID=2650748 RepID=A0A6I4MMV3_9ACTN|nr:acyl-CoA dehydrogenase family protein [Actinomadura physcomitrii]MWA04079.1 acyl-CoA dehydrogenase [Actinomadura physcomitrii]
MSYDYARAIQDVIEESTGPRAGDVDRGGAFPRANIDALARAGLLGLISAEDAGGRGEGLGAAAHVVERLAGSCGSTAMVLLMHYAATALIEAHGPKDVREAIAGDAHLSTLAFSEAGSRSHFWAPLGTAASGGDGRVLLEADKSWVTAAGEADSYVWSSRPLAADGPMTLWLVPRDRQGLTVRGPFDGLGLRGNASSPVRADGVLIDRESMLGPDGEGLDIALATALPHFLILSAAFSLGLMEALTAKAAEHLTRTRLEHLGQTLADQPMQRTQFAGLRIRTDQVRAFLRDALAALAEGREDATLRVLEVKAVAAEAASDVADAAMRLCGGAAFRREFGVERLFRDALAARVMAPTTQALHDFVGRASLGMPLF